MYSYYYLNIQIHYLLQNLYNMYLNSSYLNIMIFYISISIIDYYIQRSIYFIDMIILKI